MRFGFPACRMCGSNDGLSLFNMSRRIRKARAGLLIRQRRIGILSIRIDDAKLGRNTRIENANLFLMNKRQQPLRLIFIGDELDLNAHATGQLKETALVQLMASPETTNGAER